MNVPAILSGATALAANPLRIGFAIQNQGTAPLFVLFGNGASTTVYHMILKGSTVDSDGTGGLAIFTEGAIYDGIVTVAGTTPKYTVMEMAP